MTTTLLIPAAGQSSRFGNLRPKFLLQHPKGMSMLEASLMTFEKSKGYGIDNILIVSQERFFEGMNVAQLIESIETKLNLPTEILLLNSDTKSMVETILQGIYSLDEDCELIVKDCDNHVLVDPKLFNISNNCLAYADLAQQKDVAAANKSFIKISDESRITMIVEKKIISPYINLGLVKFESSSLFVAASRKNINTNHHFVSDVVRAAIDMGNDFEAIQAEEYEDWGTLEDWLKYVDSFKTLFLDLDGVLVKNANPLSETNNWSNFEPLMLNCNFIKNLSDLGRTKIVVTTSRDHAHREAILNFIANLGLKDVELITGLPHAKRILINDFAESLPFPTAIGLSVPRNSDNLEDYLG